MKKSLLLSAPVFLAGITLAEPQLRPNIILVLADDLGYGDISGLNKQSKISTPNIDNMCRQGIVFTDAHAASALSTPSRYALMTGRYPWRTTLKQGVLDGYSKPMIPADRKTIASMISDKGYHTACIGKWHLGWEWTPASEKNTEKTNVDFSKPLSGGPTERGFDYFFGIPSSLDMAPYVFVENDKVVTIPDHIMPPQKGLKLMHGGVAGAGFKEEDCLPELTRRSLNYINEQKNTGKPFFLYLPLTAPHTPVLPSKEFRGKTSVGDYGDFVVMVDDMMRQIVETLKKNNMYENTILIFSSDNGCAPYAGVKDLEKLGHFPSYIFRGYKADVYEGGHRIPLIISWGSRFENLTDSSLVSLTDFYATFADMLGYHYNKNEAEDSYSFWPVLTGKGKTSRKDLVSVSGNGFFSIRTPRYKLVFTAGSGGWSYPRTAEEMKDLPPMQFFDMWNDPSEQNNLINVAQYSSIIKNMSLKMRKYVESGRSTPGSGAKNDTSNDWNQTKLFRDKKMQP